MYVMYICYIMQLAKYNIVSHKAMYMVWYYINYDWLIDSCINFIYFVSFLLYSMFMYLLIYLFNAFLFMYLFQANWMPLT